MFHQELESVDFYINQGYADIALDTLSLLEKQFGRHADIDIRRELLQTPPTPAATEAPGGQQISPDTKSPTADAPPATEPVTAAAPPAVKKSAPDAKLDPGLAEIMEEFRAAAEAEEPEASEGDYETHYNLGLAYKDMYMQDEAVEEFQIAAGLVRPGDGTGRYLQCCNMLGHCFLEKKLPRLAVMWFRKGLDAPGHSEDEYQALRYELGAAYEEMGNLDQAIETFSEVYGVNVSYRGVAERLEQLQARKNGNQETPATVQDSY
jgi:tetratricopeptide (TPR) repeat protein